MRGPRILVPLLAVGVLAAACSSDEGNDGGGDALRMNQIQVLGSHNSYHLQPVPEVFAGLELVSSDLAESIEYTHLPIDQQLEDFGVRQFEIDVFADPDGGLYANRQALPVIGLPAASGIAELDEPGFKVLHTQDFDFETNCLTLIDCLTVIEGWSTAHPDHVPLMIMIEAKEEDIVAAAEAEDLSLGDLDIDFTVPLEMTGALFDDLEAEITSVFPTERLITPADVQGDRDTLEEAVLDDGWPLLDDARGKVLFTLDNTGPAREIYRQARPDGGGLVFVSAEPGDPDAAFLKLNDPIAEADRIPELVEAGYLIRTRSDSPTADAREGDTTRREAALLSGAHFISTDYYTENPDFGTGFVVAIPGGAPVGCNPVNAPPSCVADQLEIRAG